MLLIKLIERSFKSDKNVKSDFIILIRHRECKGGIRILDMISQDK